MQKLQVFNFNKSIVRTVEINGEIWFVGKDIAEILGYSATSKAVIDHCRGITKMVIPSENGGKQETNIIPERDVYRLIMRSRLPEAEKFEEWVVGEVIPSIRKNGGYILNQENLTPEQIVANALVVAQNIINNQKLELENKTKQLEQAQPKVDFHDAVVGSDDTIDIGQVAKILNIGIGRNKLFEFLRDLNILRQNNEPYQKYIDLGWFRQVETRYSLPTGETKVYIKTVVFQKGLDAIRKLLPKKGVTNE